MSSKLDPFAEAARKGLKDILRLGSRAGDSLRVASNNAIEKLDVFQLERNRDSLYRELGELTYNEQVLSASESQDQESDELAAAVRKRKAELIASLREVNAEIEERLAARRS